MRYDHQVYFQRITSGEYDRATGDYGEPTVEETMVYANVTDTKTETLKLVYGDIRQGSFTVRLLHHYDEPFDRIRIGDRVYNVDYQRRLRQKHTFVVSEVQ